ncbi:P-loop containing nucleoside triphosphate hydrolase protein [Russula compacta]|nr:P-loop containing nucleoside triphosphate hydrolase protein [Russula compacta]
MSNYTSHSSYNVLRTAQAKATKSYKYDSKETRAMIISKFKHTFNDKPPYDWQIDTCKALLLRLDCIVIAGTGAGKTLLFAIPLLMDLTCQKMVIIISPLNTLEYDQAEPFKKLGLSAAAVNGEVWSKSLRQLIHSSMLMKNIVLIAIDKPHCVSQWGEGFWKRLADLDQFQSFAACLVPFLGVTVIAPPLVLEQIQAMIDGTSLW